MTAPTSTTRPATANYTTLRGTTLGIAAAMLFLALNAEDHARVKPRHSTQLGKAAKKIGVPVEIRRKDGSGLPEH